MRPGAALVPCMWRRRRASTKSRGGEHRPRRQRAGSGWREGASRRSPDTRPTHGHAASMRNASEARLTSTVSIRREVVPPRAHPI